MLPFFKIFALTFRVISRPLTAFIKIIAINRDILLFRDFFVFLGHRVHYIEIYINRKITNPKQNMDFYVKPLSSEKALAKGVESLIEYVLFYGALLMLGFYEAKKAIDYNNNQKATILNLQKKTQENDLMLTAMRKDFAELENNFKALQTTFIQELTELKKIMEKSATVIQKDNKTITEKIDSISQKLNQSPTHYVEASARDEARNKEEKGVAPQSKP